MFALVKAFAVACLMSPFAVAGGGAETAPESTSGSSPSVAAGPAAEAHEGGVSIAWPALAAGDHAANQRCD